MSHPARAEGLGKYDKGIRHTLQISRARVSSSDVAYCHTQDFSFFWMSYLYARDTVSEFWALSTGLGLHLWLHFPFALKHLQLFVFQHLAVPTIAFKEALTSWRSLVWYNFKIRDRLRLTINIHNVTSWITSALGWTNLPYFRDELITCLWCISEPLILHSLTDLNRLIDR